MTAALMLDVEDVGGLPADESTLKSRDDKKVDQ